MQLRYENKRNDTVVKIVESFANVKDNKEACEMLINKANMLGIHAKSVFEANNGLKIIEFDADGLVDIEQDWLINRETNTTCRIYGVPKGTKNKELIENINYKSLIKMPFGLYALYRETNKGLYSDGLYRKSKDKNGKYYLDITHRVVIFDSKGNIITHSISEESELGKQFGDDPSDFFKGMNKLRQPILDYIVKHGPHRGKEENDELSGAYPLASGASFDYTDINVDVSKGGRYQLATMGRFSCAGAFALFDLVENKCVAHCNNTVMTFEGSKRILMDDYSIILVDFETDHVIRKIIDVPQNTIYKYFTGGGTNRSGLNKSAREKVLNNYAAGDILREYEISMYGEEHYVDSYIDDE